MKVSFWGTAASEGWPALFCSCPACAYARTHGLSRTRSQVLLGEDTLLDFGPDTLSHALKANKCLSDIRTVLITHSHSDHFYLPDLSVMADNYNPGMDLKPMTVYGNPTVTAKLTEMKAGLETWTRADSLFIRHAEPFRWTNVDGGRVFPVRGIHITGEECLLYVVEKEGKRVFYGCDSGLFPHETNEALRGMDLDMAILECTMLTHPGTLGHTGFAELRQQKKILEDVGAITEKTQVFISHLWHGGGLDTPEALEDAVRNDGIRVAYDGLTVDL